MINHRIQKYRPNILDAVSLKELDETLILRNHIYAFKRASEIFSDDGRMGCQFFVRLINTAIHEISFYKSYVKRTKVNPPSQHVDLIQNVQRYIDGEITEEEVKYHFLNILSINGRLISTKGFSTYNHTLSANREIEEYTYHYRPVLIWEFSDGDNYFTEDSALWGINIYDDDFLTQMDLLFLLELQTVGRGLATIPENPVELFPNLDTMIQQKRELIEKMKQTSCAVADYWASRGI